MTTKAIPLPGEVRGTGRKRAQGTFPAARPLRTGWPRFQRFRVIAALVLRGMGARNNRATGGYLWAILQPLGSTLLIALAFSMMLRSPPLGTSFILFYATGTIPFRHYSAMSGAIAGAIAANRGLLAYPVVNPLDAVFAAAILALVTDAMVAVGIFAGIAAVTDADIVLDLAPVAGAFFLAALLGLGVGAVNCVLFGFFPTWKNVWSVLSRPLFLMSGILYLYDAVPTALQAFLWWNPMLQVVGLMRSGFYGSYEATYVSVPYILGVAATLFLIGGWLIRRHAAFLIEQ
jgi:capsular polysaccharide transport system permease protein